MVNVTKLSLLALPLLGIVLAVPACSDDESSTNGSPSGTTPSGGGGSSGGGSCSGAIASCKMGTLSDAQQQDMCSLVLTSIDSPAGTKFECKEGPNEGLFLTLSSQEECVASKAPASCTVTVGTLIECYKGAKNDACAAFGEKGACAPLFATDSGCGR